MEIRIRNRFGDMPRDEFLAAVNERFYALDAWPAIGLIGAPTAPLIDPRTGRLIGFVESMGADPFDLRRTILCARSLVHGAATRLVAISRIGTKWAAEPEGWNKWPDAFAPASLFAMYVADGEMDHCSQCGRFEPDTHVIDFGIGGYEYAGAPGTDVRMRRVSRCCDAEVLGG